MKTLKKIVALVLVVATIASLCLVGASAAYSEETQYPEAAAVITNKAIGVMDGYEDGTMQYDKPVTRAEAAVIISRVLLGTDTAAKLSTATAPFADVAANHWAAGSIAFLKQKGIVSGVTDTEFDPNAGVSDMAFAKMLLCAAGYGVNDEYEGAGWDIAILTDANANGVFDGTKALDLTDGATREECMLYAFNVLGNVPTVKYNATFESYYTGKSPLQTATQAELYQYTLGYKQFKLHKENSGADAFGRPAARWTVDGVAIVEKTATELPVKTFSNKVTYAALYAALTEGVVDGMDTTKSSVTVDGKPAALPTKTQMTDPAISKTNFVGTLGATTEVYVAYLGAGKYDVDIVVYNEKVAVVTKTNKSANTITLTGNKVVSGKDVDITGLVKDTVVLYTEANDVIKTVKAVTPVTGVYTLYKVSPIFGTTVTVGGQTYTVRTADVTLPTDAQDHLDKPFDLYLDSLGNVAKMVKSKDAAVTEYNYVFVEQVEADVQDASLFQNASTKLVVQVVYPTGGTDVLNYDIYFNGAKKCIKVNGTEKDLTGLNKAGIEALITENKWYSYTTTENGITLGALNSDYACATTVKVKAGRASLGLDSTLGLTAGPATTLTKLAPAAFPFSGVATVVSRAAFPVDENGNEVTLANALLVYAKDSKTVSGIYVAKQIPAAKEAYVYCATVGGTGAAGTSYDVIHADGTKETVVAPSGAMAAGKIYTITATSNGTYTAVDKSTGILNAGNFGNAILGYNPQNTIATVAADYFVTTGVDNDEDGFYTGLGTDANGDGDYTDENDVAPDVAPIVYYYDANTVIVNCTTADFEGLTASHIVLAKVDTTVAGAYNGLNYCTYIWIVG